MIVDKNSSRVSTSLVGKIIGQISFVIILSLFGFFKLFPPDSILFDICAHASKKTRFTCTTPFINDRR